MIILPPVQEVQLWLIAAGISPLFWHAPVCPFVNVAFGAAVNSEACEQFKETGNEGRVRVTGGAGSTLITIIPLSKFPQSSVPLYVT